MDIRLIFNVRGGASPGAIDLMSILPIGVVPTFGELPIAIGMRNYVVPPGYAETRLAWLMDGILARRLKCVFRFSVRPTSAHSAIASSDTLRCRFHTSPNAIGVIARHVLAPVDDTVANAPDPRMLWTTTVSGGASTAQSTIHYTGERVAAASAIVPDQYNFVDQVWTLTGNTTYECVLTQVDKLRVVGVVIYEIPRPFLDTTSDTCLIPGNYGAGLPIYDRESADVFADLLTCYNRQSSNFVSWSMPSTTARTTASATYVNLLNAATTAVGAASEGWWTYPRYHGFFDTVNTGTLRETVPIVFAAYMSVSNAGQTASLALCDANNTTAAPIVTLTRTGSTAAAWVTGIANWSVPTNADPLKVDAYLKCSGAATASVYALNVYQYA